MGSSCVFVNNGSPFEYDQCYGFIPANEEKRLISECTFVRREFFNNEIPDCSKMGDARRRVFWRGLTINNPYR